jgi:CheY-like chemotaxis protein
VKSTTTRSGPILLAEDDADIREVEELVLTSRGYRVEGVADGQEALERMRQQPHPTLVLLDFRLPRLSGEELLRIVKSDPELASIPVVVVSGDSAIQQKAREVSADGVLRKPVELADLLETVARYVLPG